MENGECQTCCWVLDQHHYIIMWKRHLQQHTTMIIKQFKLPHFDVDQFHFHSSTTCDMLDTSYLPFLYLFVQNCIKISEIKCILMPKEEEKYVSPGSLGSYKSVRIGLDILMSKLIRQTCNASPDLPASPLPYHFPTAKAPLVQS